MAQCVKLYYKQNNNIQFCYITNKHNNELSEAAEVWDVQVCSRADIPLDIAFVKNMSYF